MPGEEQSFLERKTEELTRESGGDPSGGKDPLQQEPAGDGGDPGGNEDYLAGDDSGGHDDDDQGSDDGQLGDDDEFDDAGDASDDDPGEGGELETVKAELEQVTADYKELQAEYSQVTEHRKEREAALEQASASATEFVSGAKQRFEVAQQVMGHSYSMAMQQVEALQQQLNVPNLPPDQHQALYQQVQQAQGLANSFKKLNQIAAESLAASQQEAKRQEAQVTINRMQSRVQDWPERIPKLREIAREFEMSEQDSMQITDLFTISLLNEIHDLRQKSQTVGKPRVRRKKGAPRSRVATPNRSADGRFAAADKNFREAKPGTKGAFAQRQRAKLEKEYGTDKR